MDAKVYENSVGMREIPGETLEELVGMVRGIRQAENPGKLREDYLKMVEVLKTGNYNMGPLYEALKNIKE